jgi:hypothetical protein
VDRNWTPRNEVAACKWHNEAAVSEWRYAPE